MTDLDTIRTGQDELLNHLARHHVARDKTVLGANALAPASLHRRTPRSIHLRHRYK